MKKILFCAIMALISFAIHAQTKAVSGVVLDGATSEPIVGATVLPDVGQGIATDIDGRFSLVVPQKAKKVTFSFVGFETVSLPIQPSMIVKMKEVASNLDDVVVVAYGTQKKSSITGSVSQIGNAEIEKHPVTNVTSMLEGSTTGITVTGNTGTPGDAPTILIRGVSSISGTNSPLIVLDGTPFQGSIADISPSDIESVSVLKDAASAALYGNRAANGVILITSKGGKGKGKLKLNLRMLQGWNSRSLGEYDRLSAADLMDVAFQNKVNAIFTTGYKNKKYDRSDPQQLNDVYGFVRKDIVPTYLYTNPWNLPDDQLYDQDGKFIRSAAMKGTYAEDLDWWDAATRNGHRQEYILSGSGSTDKMDYFTSISWLDEDGYIKNQNYQRFTATASVNMQPTKWLRTGVRVNGNTQKVLNSDIGATTGSADVNDLVGYCRYMAPIYPVHAHNPETGEYLLDASGRRIYDTGSKLEYTDANGDTYTFDSRFAYPDRHGIWQMETETRRNSRLVFITTGYADVILPFGITASVRGSYNLRDIDKHNYRGAETGNGLAKNGILKKTEEKSRFINWQEQLRWNYTFNNRHHFNVLLGHENYERRYEEWVGAKRNQAFPNVDIFNNYTDIEGTISGYTESYRTESWLGRVQYNLDDKYNIEGSFRRDGSSRFHKDTRWGNFGSVGANWVFSNEDFMQKCTWLNNGKLYANWGQVGNDAAAGYFDYLARYTASTQAGEPAYWMSQIPSNGLKWETAESWGIGLEAWMFDRWHLSVEYYDKKNKDQIFSLTSAASGGSISNTSVGPKVSVNMGSMSNRGVEIATDVDVFRNRDWKINIGMNLTTLTNKVTSLPKDYYELAGYYDQQGNPIYAGTNSSVGGYETNGRLVSEGYSRYTRYAVHYVGVDMMTGNALYTPNLNKYYIKREDGSILGGYYTKDESGNLVLDTGHCSELKASDYVKIGDEYYVTNANAYGLKVIGDCGLPKAYGSFSANVRWKNLTLSALFNYSLGGHVYDDTYKQLVTVSSTLYNGHKDLLNSWYGVPEGMTADSPARINRDILPAINEESQYNTAASDRWLVSRDWLCFKNLTVAYDMPFKFLRTCGVQACQISFQAENLFIKTARKGMYPMQTLGGGQSNALNPVRNFTFGINLTL